jgi:hypothetical protein
MIPRPEARGRAKWVGRGVEQLRTRLEKLANRTNRVPKVPIMHAPLSRRGDGREPIAGPRGGPSCYAPVARAYFTAVPKALLRLAAWLCGESPVGETSSA